MKHSTEIQNHSDSVKAYIRAAIVVNWMDTDGNVWATIPELKLGTDYAMELGDGWALGADGFYYHKSAVNPNDDTSVLIKSAKPLKNAPEAGYYLSIEILAQGIQADGVDSDGNAPAELAWTNDKVTVNANDTLTVTNKQ